MDLDALKQNNDTDSHQAGDAALKRFAECLIQSARNYESAGRLGGDEFLVFYTLDSHHHFSDILGKLMRCIGSIVLNGNGKALRHLSASIGGVNLAPGDRTRVDIEILISQADKLLYQAKNDKGQAIIRAVE
jgi:diguanylate cyclase (GGDEF)-like protein